MSGLLSKFESFGGERVRINAGELYEVPAWARGHTYGWPLHYVCRDYSLEELDVVPPEVRSSEYFLIAKDQFFGASLFFGSLVLLGPSRETRRGVNRTEWTPLSIEFENQISRRLPGHVIKIGILNGFHLQFGLWLNAEGQIEILDSKPGSSSYSFSGGIEGLVRRYDRTFSSAKRWPEDQELDLFIQSLSSGSN